MRPRAGATPYLPDSAAAPAPAAGIAGSRSSRPSATAPSASAATPSAPAPVAAARTGSSPRTRTDRRPRRCCWEPAGSSFVARAAPRTREPTPRRGRTPTAPLPTAPSPAPAPAAHPAGRLALRRRPRCSRRKLTRRTGPRRLPRVPRHPSCPSPAAADPRRRRSPRREGPRGHPPRSSRHRHPTRAALRRPPPRAWTPRSPRACPCPRTPPP